MEKTYYFPLEVRKTGVKVRNTRIVETEQTEFSKEKRLHIFNSYFEFERLGDYHGYWNSKDAKQIKDYINNWLKRIGEE